MPNLPGKKVGIVSCSGEELPEGTVTRLAALKVLEQLRPADTVTICLPLFLAGGEGDRAFAKFYPTIAIDGCEKRCAARGTEMYSGKPAASVIVSELVASRGLGKPEGKRRLNETGQHAVEATAERITELVDELLQKNWNRTSGAIEEITASELQEPVQARCSCASGIPVQEVSINGQMVTLIALPVIFQHFHENGKTASQNTTRELLEAVKIYNPIPADADEAYAASLAQEYSEFLNKQGAIQ
ncbi:MAG: putative zinc-binding protein [Anaerolineales bacterium]